MSCDVTEIILRSDPWQPDLCLWHQLLLPRDLSLSRQLLWPPLPSVLLPLPRLLSLLLPLKCFPSPRLPLAPRPWPVPSNLCPRLRSCSISSAPPPRHPLLSSARRTDSAAS